MRKYTIKEIENMTDKQLLEHVKEVRDTMDIMIINLCKKILSSK